MQCSAAAAPAVQPVPCFKQTVSTEVMSNPCWTALWGEHCKVRSTGSRSSDGLLMKCWAEQLRARVALKDSDASDDADGEGGLTLDSLSTEAMKVARDLCRQWGSASGNKPKSKAAPAASKVWLRRLQTQLQQETCKKLSRGPSDTLNPERGLKLAEPAGAAEEPERDRHRDGCSHAARSSGSVSVRGRSSGF